MRSSGSTSNDLSRADDGVDGQPGFDGMAANGVQDPDGHFLGWAPGRGPIVAPDDLPWVLNQGSDLVVELHLMPGAKPIAVQPTIGLFFTAMRAGQITVMIVMGSKAIDIPAGARDYAIEDRVHPAGRRRGAQRVSTRALSRARDGRSRDRCRTARPDRSFISANGASTGNRTTASPRRSRSPTRHDDRDEIFVRQLGGQSAQPESAATAGHLGTAVARRDGQPGRAGRGANARKIPRGWRNPSRGTPPN